MPQIRVLWADDQPDVAATLSSLLSAGAEVVHVPDGDAAIRELEARVYDLAILDLAMPPGQWGGLWVLEQLAERTIDLAVVVLSGEGSQAETIKAMRLGADYVRKEDAARELKERVSALIAERHARRNDRLEDWLVAPLAVPYRRLSIETRPVDRLRRALSAAEAILRFVALVNTCKLMSCPDMSGLIAARQLRAPSAGVWLQLARTSTSRLDGGFGGGIRWKTFDRVIRARNDLVHGGEISERAAEPIVTEIETVIRDALSTLPPVQLLYFRSLDFDGKTFTATATRMHGHSPALESVRLELPRPVLTGAVHIENPSGWLSLDPLVRAHPAAQAGDWEIHLLDGIRWDGHGALRPYHPLLYGSLWAAERRITEDRATVGGILHLLS